MERPIPPETSLNNPSLSPSVFAEKRYRTYTLLLVVILQCLLYGIHLNLLPMWEDETFTFATASHTPRQIIAIVRDDIHPPLYFLLAHWWIRLPISSDVLVRLRALSVVFVILTTVVLDRLWLRAAPRRLRNWFLLFWMLSPCLLLLGRMARSYSLQMLLAAVAIGCVVRFAEKPAVGKKLAAFVVSLAALLYTHYLAGIAVWAGANLLILLQRSRLGQSVYKRWLVANALVVTLYLPWLITLAGALQQWEHNQVHNLTGGFWAEQLIKIAYLFYSFTFGESIPIWLLPITLVLALPCLWLFVSGARLRSIWLWPGLFAATVAFLGATRWVTTPFMGARLLFLLPLFLLALASGINAKGRAGLILGIALIAANLAGVGAYFQGKDILNLAYLIPNQRMAEDIALRSRPDDTVVWIDAVNFDEPTLAFFLPKDLRVRALDSPESIAAARQELDSGDIRHVWLVRSVHDISPGHAFEETESQMMATWPEHDVYYYLELSPTHRAILRALEILRHQNQSQPRQYMYQVMEFRRPN
jgi:uncharacterized membrane protein